MVIRLEPISREDAQRLRETIARAAKRFGIAQVVLADGDMFLGLRAASRVELEPCTRRAQP